MDDAQATAALEKLLKRGQGILKHQPVERKTCEGWTAAAREIFAEIYGTDAKVYRELVAANRKIFTSFETDPSYYITQLVANLHRELRVLEKCAKEKRRSSAAHGAIARPKKPKFAAFLWSPGPAAAESVQDFLKDSGFEVVAVNGKGKGEPFWKKVAQANMRYGVVVLPGAGDAAGLTDAIFVCAYLAGRLGSARTLVLLESSSGLPGTAEFLRTVALKDTDAWQSKLKADLDRIAK